MLAIIKASTALRQCKRFTLEAVHFVRTFTTAKSLVTGELRRKRTTVSFALVDSLTNVLLDSEILTNLGSFRNGSPNRSGFERVSKGQNEKTPAGTEVFSLTHVSPPGLKRSRLTTDGVPFVF